jgi:hypothetical protein
MHAPPEERLAPEEERLAPEEERLAPRPALTSTAVMRRGKRHPADDDDQDKTLVLERDELDYPLPAPPTDQPTLVHPVAAPPFVDPEPPTEALQPTPPPAATRAQTRPRRATTRRPGIRPFLALAIALAAAAALAITIILATGPTSTVAATVRTDANVRAAPSTTAQVVGSLTAGQHITLKCATKTAAGGTWDRLASPQNARYVASWLVAPAGKLPAC